MAQSLEARTIVIRFARGPICQCWYSFEARLLCTLVLLEPEPGSPLLDWRRTYLHHHKGDSMTWSRITIRSKLSFILLEANLWSAFVMSTLYYCCTSEASMRRFLNHHWNVSKIELITTNHQCSLGRSSTWFFLFYFVSSWNGKKKTASAVSSDYTNIISATQCAAHIFFIWSVAQKE